MILARLAIRVLIGGVFATAAVVSAQSPEASIVGTVKDPSAARVPGAHLSAKSLASGAERETNANALGEFRFDLLPPGRYQVRAAAPGFQVTQIEVALATGVTHALEIQLAISGPRVEVEVRRPIDTASSVVQTVVSARDTASIPLAARSFANIAYFAPMTQPVEPSDPTKARITAVSFAGSSGLNVDLSVDGGDNNDDYIGGFLQNFSPDAIEEFNVRTAQFDADTSRTNGGSVIITTRRGNDQWHGSVADYFRGAGLNARNPLDNPEPNPKQPFSRNHLAGSIGGPIVKQKLWFFTAFEYVDEDASISYSNQSLAQFQALAQLASMGLVPGVTSISIPSSVPVLFRDSIFSTRVDWRQSDRSEWFLRGATDRYHTANDLLQQATLPSTGAYSRSNYWNVLLHNDFQFNQSWLGVLTLQANSFHRSLERNSNYGFALAFPFSTTQSTISGFETFGDNQFVTPITAFPVERDQRKYQVRYDLARSGIKHSVKVGVNFIDEPELSGRLSDNPETLVSFPLDPTDYLANPTQFPLDYAAGSSPLGGSSGIFSQHVRRFGVYAQDAWRMSPSLTLNLGLRYDTTFGLFTASGREQDQNSAYITLKALGLDLVSGIPHDYRGAIAPRIGLAWAPGGSGKTVVRAGIGLYYNDLAQNGWVAAFQAVNAPPAGLLQPADKGALIDPRYKTPYALQASLGFEHDLGNDWRVDLRYQHQQGVHQYRRYEYVSGSTLPDDAPSISLFRSDNRSRYDGISFGIQHRFSNRFDLSAHYTLASAATWGAVVGELFDYVNGVSDVRNPFGPGDHGPSGEDVRHRVVVTGRVQLPGKFELATLSQFESARPFTLATSLDVNNDGNPANDRAVVNGAQTSLDQFRGTAFIQVDLRVSRPIRLSDRTELRPFLELFNVFNRQNPGNNYVGQVAALSVPPNQLANVTQHCLDPGCTATRAVTLNDLRVPAGALGDFFGPGTTVGIPFTAQLGLRLSF
ncbi:MAG TPA: TonB-dependent receptor [Vicinamibacteria bacterium]|jgi:hypothetical protein|nr:TonB-dependent receptor [Vicinamibacteria bacterium]